MSTRPRLLIALTMTVSPACASLRHHIGTVTVGESRAKLESTVEEERVVGSPSLTVSDVQLDAARLSLVLGAVDTCARVTARTYEVTDTVERAWVDRDGGRVSMGTYAAAQILLGIVAPVVAVGCAATRECGPDSSGSEPEPAPDGSTVRTALVVGSVVGGTLVLSGLIDAIAGASAGQTSEVTSERVDRAEGARYPCRARTLAHAKGAVAMGSRRVELETDEEGRARVDLESLGADAVDLGALPLRVSVDGIEEAQPLEQLAPHLVARALGRPSESDLRRHVVAALPIEFVGAHAGTATHAAALLEVYSASLSAAGFRLVPSAAIARALDRESSETYRPCVDDACQIELGRQLAASVVLRTTVVRIDGECTVSAVPFELRTATTLAGATRHGACEPAQLRDGLATVAADLAR